jgi:DNA-binding CsgD family transcriptional regulator
LQTLRLLYDGNDTTQIANARGVAQRTVETQLGRVYAKLGVHSALQAVSRARLDGIFA